MQSRNERIAVEAGTLEAEESEEFEAKFRTRPAPLRGAADIQWRRLCRQPLFFLQAVCAQHLRYWLARGEGPGGLYLILPLRVQAVCAQHLMPGLAMGGIHRER